MTMITGRGTMMALTVSFCQPSQAVRRYNQVDKYTFEVSTRGRQSPNFIHEA